jgi:hypothetical protein
LIGENNNGRRIRRSVCDIRGYGGLRIGELMRRSFSNAGDVGGGEKSGFN